MFNVLLLLSIGCVAGYLLHDHLDEIVLKVKGLLK